MRGKMELIALMARNARIEAAYKKLERELARLDRLRPIDGGREAMPRIQSFRQCAASAH